MKRRHLGRDSPLSLLVLGAALALVILAVPAATDAQPMPKVPRIGVIPNTGTTARSPLISAFERGFRDLGYVEGKTIAFEYRWSDAMKPTSSEVRAAELVRLKVDVLVVGGGAAALAAKKATATIPIVIALAPDPVGEGLVASLSRPGGNITGLSLLSRELASKQLELLKAAAPRISRVAVLSSGNIPSHRLLLEELEIAARALAVTVHALDVRAAAKLESAFAEMAAKRADGLLVLPNSIWLARGTELHDLAAKYRIPAMYSTATHPHAGGLMSYGADPRDNWQRAATYVDKILKGAKPGDLPVEQPTKFEFVINLKTAKALGLTIPNSLLVGADEVIQ